MTSDSNPSDTVSTLLELSCLTYTHVDGPSRWKAARDMLERRPELGHADVWAAACTGDVAALTTMLAAEPNLATRRGGPHGWPPLLYACYCRLDAPGRSTLDAARLLLERGADPNAHYMWGGQYRFTAVTGAFGEGELGPRQQPPHQDAEQLARMLLEAGADPNDSQALYNTMFTPGDRCLEMLLEFGLGTEARCNWLIGCGPSGLRPNPQGTLHYQLMWAVRNGHTSRARLLMTHGVDVTQPDARSTPWKAAVMAGHVEVLADLLRHGAREEPLSDVESFAAACMAGEAERARRLAVTDASLPGAARAAFPRLLADAASMNRPAAARCLLEYGWEANAMPDGSSALHQAAWHGHRDMAELLIASEADPGRRDAAHDATPAQWAAYAGHDELATLLASHETAA